ncbi:MAG TPA: hypothetical protein VGM22_02225 [Methylomirabilota bacterium]|jgi:hypothetical protein
MKLSRTAAVLLVAAVAVAPLTAMAAEKKITAIKDIAGTWQGWVNLGGQQARATMRIKEDGSYEASTQTGSLTVGQYYLDNGTLRYRSSRTEGTATVSEEGGKTFLTVIPTSTTYESGKTEYERVK